MDIDFNNLITQAGQVAQSALGGERPVTTTAANRATPTTAPTSTGIPKWAIIAGVVVLVLGGFLFLRKKKS
jgi:LPXTG-motif cell wall-anchored protein